MSAAAYEMERPGDLEDRISQTVSLLRTIRNHYPQTAIVLGSGLGQFVESMTVETCIPYRELTHFPCSTAPGHAGRLVCGTIADIPILALQGRCHLYEGISAAEATYPVRVLKQLGVRRLILSCAAGGLATDLAVGDLLILHDQLNLQQRKTELLNQLISPARQTPYQNEDVTKLVDLARQLKISARSGTYLSVTGPNYETRAEQRMLKNFGDAVGMSMVAESMTAFSLGIQVHGIAMITNLCRPDHPQQTDGDHVVQAARNAEPMFRKLVVEFLRVMHSAE
jgi:purine-nucleoside phosphorylase